MVFEANYKDCVKLIEKDFEALENFLEAYIELDKNELSEDLKDYLSAKSKRIRSGLVFLFSKLLYDEVGENTLKLAAAVELVHNATLIHDDIIDDAPLRRGKTTFHKKYDDKLSIIAGDYLLSLAIKLLQQTDAPAVVANFSNSLMNLCNGEISQYFNKFKTPSIENYIEKSKNKTASLFIAALNSLSDINSDPKNKKILDDFAKNFGIAFQIHDDLQNILDEQGQKPLYKDIENGIYTAPVIFALNGEDTKNLSAEKIVQKARTKEALNKTNKVLEKYVQSAIEAIKPFKECDFKNAIINICNLLLK